MRRLAAFGTLLAAFALTAACGRGEEIGFGGAPAPSVTGAPATTSPATDGIPEAFAAPEGTSQLPGPKVDANALPEGYPRTVWTVGDGRTVGLYGQAGGCTEATAEVAEQDVRRVVLRIVETTTGAGACTMELRFPPLTVTLDEALGERTVVLERTQAGPR